MDNMVTYRYYRPASRITILAHIFGVIAMILMLVWLLHYREGVDLDSYDPDKIFNVHPLLMYLGVIFLSGEALMAYKTVRGEREVKKSIHFLLHLAAIILGIVGIHAAFKYHDGRNLSDMYSFHSWIGIGTFCLYILQWIIGLCMYMLPYARVETRIANLPWHISGGRAIFYMTIVAALTGLMQKSTWMQLPLFSGESLLINFLAIFTLLFGVTVDMSVALARYA
ncbi:probable transmembrane ascorbate ferrireductase 3 isoform X2 [Lycium ferocissimum]|uniref:probable transmembrane ascorbate ferrireductase 3 isoform X2 n=1 Tax=Lycium ferocissimum TaxID=112874 RepID=UPI002815F843|nr:probable transmembrane ascorbate ferrireductase 3 isoform X2 [Lycium ferocissimum]